MSKKFAALTLVPVLALVLAACQTMPETSVTRASSPETLGFAQAACGGCHAVEAMGLSPNPEAPTFADIANTPGLTQATLHTWLRDAHNYPEAMEFDLEPPRVQELVAHILTLRRADYHPPIS